MLPCLGDAAGIDHFPAAKIHRLALNTSSHPVAFSTVTLKVNGTGVCMDIEQKKKAS